MKNRVLSAIAFSVFVALILRIAYSGRVSGYVSVCVATGLLLCLVSVVVLESLINRAGRQPFKKRNGFDYATHYFRGFAILAVMACHFCSMTGHNTVNRLAFTAATHFFLFISGYLCQFLYTKKPFKALDYYDKKVKNVFLPYCFFSLLFCCINTAITKGIDGVISVSTVVIFAKDLMNGSAQGQYWYIPFVLTLFVISPKLCKISNCGIIASFIVALLISVVIPMRQFPWTYSWPGVLYLYTYFVPYYLLGFVYARYKMQIDNLINQFGLLVFCIAVLLWVLMIYGTKAGIHLVEDDLVISMQRLCMIGVAIFLFNKIKDKQIKLFDMFATYSFTLFFVHNYFFGKILSLIPMSMRGNIADVLIFIFLSIVLTVICAWIKQILGRYSRPIIGA